MAEQDQLFDVAIVGYGPAGITAAIYAARKRLRILLVGEIPGGEVVASGDIENWPGSGETTGVALADELVKHLKMHEDMVAIEQTLVDLIAKDGDEFVIDAKGGETWRARTVIYAAGRHPRELGVPGETEFKNRGVSYCATCDAPLFSDKDVAVVGGGNTGAEAVIMFQKIARKIYLLHINDKLPADQILIQNFENDPKVEIIYQAKTTEISGDAMVESLSYQDMVAGKNKKIEVQGVFVTIGALPNTDPIKDLVELDKFGSVVADRYAVTNLDGFFAAGDVTNIRDAQIVVAAGQGCSAALSVGDFLSRQKT